MSSFRIVSTLFITLMMLFAAGCASTPTRASLGESIDDTVITTRVKAAFIDDPSLKALEINVETFKGVVQLSGFVGTRAEVNQASSLARRIDGVTSVRNDIIIK